MPPLLPLPLLLLLLPLLPLLLLLLPLLLPPLRLPLLPPPRISDRPSLASAACDWGD